MHVPLYHKSLVTTLFAMALVAGSLGFATDMVRAATPTPQKPEAAKPPQPKKLTPEIVRERWAKLRRSQLTDEELRKQLLLAGKVDMGDVRGTKTKLINASALTSPGGFDMVPVLVSQRPDLIGLPLRPPSHRRLSKEEAINLQVLSQQLRLHVEKSIPGITDQVLDLRPDPDVLRKLLLNNPLRDAWLRPEAILPLRQLLMHEHRNVRLILVDLLAMIRGPQASAALAERALFDLNADVRLAAVVALLDRPIFEYEDVLIAGLRYPWAAAADHAAEALVALNLRGAVPKLVPLLDARDLDEPYVVESGQTRWAVLPQLVRLNHHRNCLLCHATSFAPTDPVRGLVPNADQRLPLPSSGYGPKLNVKVPTWIRADITYFKQDFTVVQPVANHGKLWPADQRFDYMVRQRPLTSDELHIWQEKVRDFRPPPPQRDSLMFVLRELTGENPGPNAEDWKRLYSPISGQRLKEPVEPKNWGRHISDWLVQAPLKQAEVLVGFKERSGPAYDDAVATAIPQLKTEVQKLARAVLADRCFCLSADALRERLGNQEAEIRRAAVQVCGQRKLKDLTPELIGLLGDADAAVAKQAHKLLVQFAGKDLGPRAATDAERQRAMAAWREWYAERERKQKERKGAGP
ncbi:MAG: hypothetical protein L0211_00405 [Planctomycetaceae bacterium]|nr:hypothetical protein [Planctomycetaceae bacterium]